MKPEHYLCTQKSGEDTGVWSLLQHGLQGSNLRECQVWQQAPLPAEPAYQPNMSDIIFYYYYEHFSREQNRIQTQNHGLCLEYKHIVLESILDKTYNQTNKQKKNLSF